MCKKLGLHRRKEKAGDKSHVFFIVGELTVHLESARR